MAWAIWRSWRPSGVFGKVTSERGRDVFVAGGGQSCSRNRTRRGRYGVCPAGVCKEEVCVLQGYLAVDRGAVGVRVTASSLPVASPESVASEADGAAGSRWSCRRSPRIPRRDAGLPDVAPVRGEMFIETVWLGLISLMRSAMRPAQPTPERLCGTLVCHCSIWSGVRVESEREALAVRRSPDGNCPPAR